MIAMAAGADCAPEGTGAGVICAGLPDDTNSSAKLAARAWLALTNASVNDALSTAQWPGVGGSHMLTDGAVRPAGPVVPLIGPAGCPFASVTMAKFSV